MVVFLLVRHKFQQDEQDQEEVQMPEVIEKRTGNISEYTAFVQLTPSTTRESSERNSVQESASLGSFNEYRGVPVAIAVTSGGSQRVTLQQKRPPVSHEVMNEYALAPATVTKTSIEVSTIKAPVTVQTCK